MPKFAGRAFALFVLLLVAAGTSVSAATNDFYLNLLRRGIANFEAGQFDAAVRELDVAAFGLIESVDHFETAKVYAAIANDKLGRAPQARAAAQRILAAERVQRRFAQVTLPAEVRTAFLAVARKLLSAAEVTALSRENAPVPPAPAGQPRVVQQQTPATTRPQTPVQPPAPQPPPVTAAATTVPTPQNSSTTTTEPQRATVPEPKPAEPKLPEPKPVVPAPQTTTPPRETPRKVEETVIAFPPEPAKPQPKPEVVKVDPPEVEPVKVEPPKVDPPKADPPKPVPAPAKPATQPVPRDIPARLASAERLLSQNNLIESRAIYRELIDVPTLDHATILSVGEGLYRARDFAGAVRAFERAGTLRNGEEPYRYYLAVALYETGNYAKAKRELAAALPHIEITPSVTRYRAKIEGAID